MKKYGFMAILVVALLLPLFSYAAGDDERGRPVIQETPLACTLYVAPQGLDANDGRSRSTAFRTLQKAADLVSPGDVVCVRQGTYTGFELRRVQGTAQAPIVFQSYPGERATIEPFRHPNSYYYNILIPSGSGVSKYLVFDNFEITDSDPLIDQLRQLDLTDAQDLNELGRHLDQMNRTGVRISRNSTGETHNHLVFKNLEIHHLLGVGFSGGGPDLVFLNNHVYDLGWPRSGYGWYTSGERHVYKNNLVHDNAGYGFHLYSNALTDAVLEGNVVYGCGGTWYHMSSGNVKRNSGAGLLIWGSGRDNLIQNNLFYNNVTGITLSNASDLVVNNTVHGNSREGLELRSGNRSTTVHNNILFDNGNDFSNQGSGTLVSHNLISQDPDFESTDPASNGFLRPSAGSAVIDAGTGANAPGEDIEGTARPQDAGYDIGAFEYTPGGTNRQPRASFTADPTSGQAPLSVTFDATSSSDPDGTLVAYEWLFGDGATASGSSVAHTFALKGDYSVTLTVTDDDGATDSISVVIHVGSDSAPASGFEAYRTESPIQVNGLLTEDSWAQADWLSFSNPARSDNQVTVRALWDDDYLYFAYEVTDSHLEAENQKLWQDDGAEIFMDTGNNKTTSMDSNDYHFMININDMSNPAGINVKTITTTNGYTMEMAIPWGLINTIPSRGNVMGLLLGNNDWDNGSYSQFDWPGLIETGNYFRPHLWGEIVLSGETGTTCDGDLNTDGRIDVADLQMMVNIILGTNSDENCADLDENGTVNVADLQGLINRILMK